MAIPRVVSLLPSATEIVCALGARDALVGRSHECDFPASPGEDVRQLPACTRANLSDGSARAIDDEVRRLVRSGLSLYDVELETLGTLAPDWILTQDQCAVCAATLDDVERAVASLCDAGQTGPRVLSLSPTLLADVWDDIARVADALGLEARGRSLRDAMSERVGDLGERSASLGTRPRVACIEWTDPLMSAGNWVPELVRLAGGEPLFASAGEHSGWLEWETLREADPDLIVLMPCGFDLPRSEREAAPLRALPGWTDLRAVREGRVYATDGNAYFNRPGPRLADSAAILAEICHPEAFGTALEGSAWRRWQ